MKDITKIETIPSGRLDTCDEWPSADCANEHLQVHRSVDGRPAERVLVVPRVQELYRGPPHAWLQAQDHDHREVLVLPHLRRSENVMSRQIVRER